MDEYQAAKLAGSKIFKQAIEHINQHGWNHNSMEILLKASGYEKWPQPMAVLMFAELSNELGSETLTAFDKRATSKDEVTKLFSAVAKNLSTSSN